MDLRQLSPLGPVDTTKERMLAVTYGRGNPVYSRNVVERIADLVLEWTQRIGLRTSVIWAQITLETNGFQFTGDVDADQYNLAGMGATGGGVKGHYFNSLEDGVVAVCVHHLLYLGRDVAPDLAARDPRWGDAIRAGKWGVIKTVGDYGNGNWATDPLYVPKLIDLLERTIVAALRVIVSAGHLNTSGGNELEKVFTAELAEAYYRAFVYQGADIRVVQGDGADPDLFPGDKPFPGSLSDAAGMLGVWARDGWVADLFVETHTDGGGGRGISVLYPDWGSDTDTDVRDRLGPSIMAKMSAATGLRQRMIMSEKSSNVGGQGFRLGVFGATAGQRASTTRMIVEHGFHDNAADRAVIQSPGFFDEAARAFVEATYEFYGRALSKWEYQSELPKATGDPNARFFQETGQWVVYEIKHFHDALGNKALPVVGLPLSGEFIGGVDRHLRHVQIFERGVVAIYHDTPADDPFRIRVLTFAEAANVLFQAGRMELLDLA